MAEDDDFEDRPRRSHRDDDDYNSGGRTPHRGTLILVLGILSLVACAPLGIAAWTMGKNDLAAIQSGRMDRSGKDMTQIGYVLGIIGTVLFVVQLLAVCLWFALVGAMVGGGAR